MRLLGILLAIGIAAAPLVTHAQQSSVIVVINGEHIHFKPPPIVRSGRVFVPLRGVFERLGATVNYANRHIDARGRGRTVSLTIDSPNAMVNGKPEIIDVPPFIVDQYTFVPLRFVSQSMGASVNWNENSYTVTIIALPVGRHGGLVPPRTR